MNTLPHHLYIRCRDVLLRCSEFDSDYTLKAVFVTDDLSVLQSKLPSAFTKADRVDQGLAYLLEKQMSNRTPAILVFLRVLRDRYPYGDSLRDDLTHLYDATSHVLTHPGNCSRVNPVVSWVEEVAAYSVLERLLKSHNWKESDIETGRLLLQWAGHKAEQRGHLLNDDMEQLPDQALCTIDQLWQQYSNYRFGFSVQQKIWQSVNGNLEAFGDRVGWRILKTVRTEQGGWWLPKVIEEQRWEWVKHNNLTFDLKAPEGHLPFGSQKGVIWRVARGGLASLTARLTKD